MFENIFIFFFFRIYKNIHKISINFCIKYSKFITAIWNSQFLYGEMRISSIIFFNFIEFINNIFKVFNYIIFCINNNIYSRILFYINNICIFKIIIIYIFRTIFILTIISKIIYSINFCIIKINKII